MIKIIGHGLSALLAPGCEQREAFKLGVRQAAARIFALDDNAEIDLADVKMYLSHFSVPVAGQAAYDIVLEVEVPWSEDLDKALRELSTRLRTAARELAKLLGYELKIAVWGRIVRTEWITDEVADFVTPGQGTLC